MQRPSIFIASALKALEAITSILALLDVIDHSIDELIKNS